MNGIGVRWAAAVLAVIALGETARADDNHHRPVRRLTESLRQQKMDELTDVVGVGRID